MLYISGANRDGVIFNISFPALSTSKKSIKFYFAENHCLYGGEGGNEALEP